MGVYWIHPNVCPSVCPSVRPSVWRQGFRNFLKKTIGSIHSIPGIYSYGVSLLTPIHFRVPSLIFGPSVAKYLAENSVSGTFWKNYWPNSFHTRHLPLWGVSWPFYIFVFLASFSALWWPNIWLKMGFPELFEKTIGSIHFIPGIYPYGVSLLTPIHFHVPSLIFGPLVAKCLAENGVSGTFWKKVLTQFISNLAFTLMGWVSWPLYIFVFLVLICNVVNLQASFSALWWPNIWLKMGFPDFLKLLVPFITYLAFIFRGIFGWGYFWWGG